MNCGIVGVSLTRQIARRVLSCVVGVVLLTGCVSQVSKTAVPVDTRVAESLQRYTREYVLAAGDSLDVVVYRNPGLSRQALIRGDGFISLPVLDDVRAAGRTPRELDDELTERLKARLLDPEVTVIVTNAREPMVYVIGEVQAAMPVPLRDARTAAQAIARVGMVNRGGDLRQVSVIRLDDTGHLRAFTIESAERSQPALFIALQNTPLQADDLVLIPESNRSQAVRRIQDYVTTPLGALNTILTPYFQMRLIEDLEDDL
jgi:polysaccharide export outer membrane protein